MSVLLEHFLAALCKRVIMVFMKQVWKTRLRIIWLLYYLNLELNISLETTMKHYLCTNLLHCRMWYSFCISCFLTAAIICVRLNSITSLLLAFFWHKGDCPWLVLRDASSPPSQRTPDVRSHQRASVSSPSFEQFTMQQTLYGKILCLWPNYVSDMMHMCN